MRKKSILLVAVFVLISSFNFGCSSNDSREHRTSDYISESETYHQYSFNEYSSLVKVQFDSINPRAVTLSDGILIRQCILVDAIVEQDYFEHVQKNAHITIPIFTTYYPSGETNNPIELIDDVILLINKMDDSYFYFETLIIDNRYRNTYKFDDGTFYEPVFDMPNNPFNLYFYENFIYFIDDHLSESSITELLYVNNIRKKNVTEWDTEYFVDGMSRETVEKEIKRQAEYATINKGI